MSYGDIYRIVNGYDDCGNVCGRANSFTDDSSGCKVSITAYNCKYISLFQHFFYCKQVINVYVSCVTTYLINVKLLFVFNLLENYCH